jgi:hypothetical protein
MAGSGIEARDRRARIGFGAANLAIALFVAVGVFRLLPTRWWLVDGGAAVVALLLASSGIALLRSSGMAERLTRIAAAVVLVLGLALFAALALTASWISGVYAQVGSTGAIVFGLVALLVFPYLVVFPAVELAWIGPRAAPKAQ